MPRTAQSVPEARSTVGEALTGWGLDDLVETGVLLVSELATNSVRHTSSRLIQVIVTRIARNTVRIAVMDQSRTPPVCQEPDDDSSGGRGLVIVEALTARWGTDVEDWGKAVWGELESGGASG